MKPDINQLTMMSKEIKQTISLRDARRLAIRQALLSKSIPLARGIKGAARAIEHLGYVQIDTIAVIERAHHHTLWTRIPDYRPEMIEELLAKDRRVFEYWGHAASYLPMSDYRFYMPRMRAFPRGNGWIKRMYEGHKQVMKEVLARIKREGPLTSSDFKAPQDRKRGTWWDWKPAKTALELLLWRGDLMVSARRNFQRVYDLTQRVLPDSLDTSMPGPAEVARFRVERALSAYGIATEREILDHLHLSSKASDSKEVGSALAGMVRSDEAVRLTVGHSDAPIYYALSRVLDETASLRKDRRHLHLLSPFDNLVIQRRRLERLFGFPYTLECYLPRAKRKYGYFTLPILWGDEFVGRLDPKAERASTTLRIESILFEPGFNEFEKLAPPLAKNIISLARFNSCNRVSLLKVTPGKIKPLLERLLNALIT